jgi:hypothetical protein
MYKYATTALLMLLIAACRKPQTENPPAEPKPVMEYRELNNTAVRRNQPLKIDLNGDGAKDIWFYTEDVADTYLEKTYLKFYALSLTSTSLPMTAADKAPVAEKGRKISDTSFPGYEWWPISEVTLAQKVTENSGPVYWQGLWKGAIHQFLPFAVTKSGSLYYGWLELSFDTTAENIILHRFGISKEAGKEVLAGL